MEEIGIILVRAPVIRSRREALAYQAKNYALHMMRTMGSVPPTVIADTKDGFIFLHAMADEWVRTVKGPWPR